MKRICADWVGLLVAWMTAAAGGAFATDYTWIGGGTDNNWTTTGNWNGTGFPSVAGDVAIVTAANTINLNTNDVINLGRLQFISASPKVVTVTGDAGAGFTFSGLAAPGNGITVDGNTTNRLILGPDFVISSRIDKMGAGAVEFTGTQTYPAVGGYGWVFGQGQSVYSGIASLSAANGSVGIGNASSTATVVLTNQAVWMVNRIEFGVSSGLNTLGILCQDADECSVTVGQLVLGNMSSSGGTNGIYRLRKGTLTANILTVGYASPCRFEQSGGSLAATSLKVKNGVFCQTGGVSAVSSFAVGDTNLIPSVTLAGGRLLLNSNITTPWMQEKQAFNFSGGALQVTNSYSCEIPMRLCGTPTFDATTSGKGLTLSKRCSGNSQLVKTGAGTLFLGTGTTNAFSGGVVISNGVFNMGANSLLESYGQSVEPLGMKICNGGIFRLTDINSVVTVPLALDIDAGGKIDFPYSFYYNRNIVVARTLVTNGVSLVPGRYTTAHGFITGGTAACSVVVPIVWTGAGDGVSWSDAANWVGNTVPNATTAVADLSNARQSVRLDGAVTLTCLVYNPQGVRRDLTLTGDGTLSLYVPVIVSPCLFVGPGRTLTLDVPLDRTPAGQAFGSVGGGAVIIKKKFPGIGPGQGSSFSLYGNLIFAGITTMPDMLGLWRHELNSDGSVVFTNGCQLTTPRILNNPSGFYPLRQICHDGGMVTCGDVFLPGTTEMPQLPIRTTCAPAR